MSKRQIYIAGIIVSGILLTILIKKNLKKDADTDDADLQKVLRKIDNAKK